MVLWLILMAATLLGLAFIVWVLRYLRLNHHQTWIELGSPSLVWNNSMRNNFLFLKFIFKREHVPLADPKLTSLCGILRVFYVSYFTYFAVLLVLFPFAG